MPIMESNFFIMCGLVCAAMISLFSLAVLAVTRVRRREMRLLMRPAFVNLLFIISVGLELLLNAVHTPEAALLCRISVPAQFILARVLIFEFLFYILYLLQMSGAHTGDRRVYTVLEYVGMIPMILNTVYPFFYYITDDNRFVLQPGWVLYPVLELFNMVILAWILYRYRRYVKLYIAVPAALFCAAILSSLAVLLAGVVQVTIFPFFSTLGVLLISMQIQSNLITEHYQMDAEFKQVQARRVVIQMKPHFLYNALSSISQLTKSDPAKASEMTDRFSEFLHSNMDAMYDPKPIPFARELVSVENYLEIEKMRFGEDMEVLFRIEDTDFEIPPMVLQPLLENAIKHGIGGREEGGTILVSARKCAGGHVVTVADDGVGFDPRHPLKGNDGRVHVGMESARKRMAQIPGATIVHSSRPGIGTTVTLFLPDPEPNR